MSQSSREMFSHSYLNAGTSSTETDAFLAILWLTRPRKMS